MFNFQYSLYAFHNSVQGVICIVKQHHGPFSGQNKVEGKRVREAVSTVPLG